MQLDPKLSADMFDGDGLASFTLCGACKVTYHNPDRRNTFGDNAASVKYMEVWCDAPVTRVDGAVLGSELAKKVREGKINKIEAFM